MKAVQIHAHGGIDQLRYQDVDEPQLQSHHDVIVKLKAAAVNRVDLAVRSGINGESISFPRTIGADGAGTVFSAGVEVRNVKPGDAVCLYPIYGCGDCQFCAAEQESRCGQRRFLGERDNGTYAEFVRVPAQHCFAMPGGLSFEAAAAFPLVYVTVWRMLITQADLKPGESILIVGAGGGIATAALQVASATGARVIVTSGSEEKLLAAGDFGAEHGINCNRAEFAKAVRSLTGKRGVDVVVNCVGGASWAESLASLARGGRLVTCGGVAGAHPKTDLRRVFWNHLKLFAANSGTRQEFLRVLNFFADAQREPIMDQVFSLKDARSAHQRLEERKQFGKIVLRMDS
ncbi:MAG: zinc-binding dehydrogenase [Candidatus Binatia bacterium]